MIHCMEHSLYLSKFCVCVCVWVCACLPACLPPYMARLHLPVSFGKSVANFIP